MNSYTLYQFCFEIILYSYQLLISREWVQLVLFLLLCKIWSFQFRNILEVLERVLIMRITSGGNTYRSPQIDSKVVLIQWSNSITWPGPGDSSDDSYNSFNKIIRTWYWKWGEYKIHDRNLSVVFKDFSIY